MSYHKLHHRQKTKNYALLLILFSLVGMFFFIATIKMGSYLKNQTTLVSKDE